MLNEDDLLRMREEATELIADNTVAITIRRDGTSLAAQSVRLLKRKGGSISSSTDGLETRAPVLILGSTTMDVAIDDTFTLSGILYRVMFIQPDQRAGTMVEAELAT
jgi:hypothetical protein